MNLVYLAHFQTIIFSQPTDLLTVSNMLPPNFMPLFIFCAHSVLLVLPICFWGGKWSEAGNPLEDKKKKDSFGHGPEGK